MICFIDFETTGTHLIEDYPLELGAVLVDNNLDTIKHFHSFIQPSKTYQISELASKIHGITHTQILQAPNESSVLHNFYNLIGTNYRLAAWNMSFDIGFFKILNARNGFESFLDQINYRHLDVQTISYLAKELGIIPNNIFSLSELVSFFGLERKKFHNALEDAILVSKVFKLLVSILKKHTFNELYC